jgi:SHS2 domain-containing protein
LTGGFQRTDHTADEGIRVWGKSGKELFEEAAKGMVSIMVTLDAVEPAETRIVEVEADSAEELLLRWLREILYLFETESVVFSRFQIEKDNISNRKPDKFFLRASVGGEKLNPLRHGICKEIKSITRHGFYIHEKNPWWEANILFDV